MSSHAHLLLHWYRVHSDMHMLHPLFHQLILTSSLLNLQKMTLCLCSKREQDQPSKNVSAEFEQVIACIVISQVILLQPVLCAQRVWLISKGGATNEPILG